MLVLNSLKRFSHFDGKRNQENYDYFKYKEDIIYFCGAKIN
jgi:hypothetical protein